MTTYMRTLVRIGLGFLALVLLQLGALEFVQAQQTGADFDHSSTGFVLNAQHQNVRCETCHTKGMFKGTPKTCEACHGWNNPRAATVMPSNHIPTRNAPCESCHAANMSQFQDALRVFSHVNVPAMTCLNCHDSRNPKPGVRTNPADPQHTDVLANNTPCGQCHTTLQFTANTPSAGHIPVAAVACTACHKTGDFKVMPSVTDIHANAKPGTTCAQCHGNATTFPMSPPIMTAPAGHIAMNGNGCEVCHVGSGSSTPTALVTDGTTFANSAFSHAGISSGCANCHGAIGQITFPGISNIVAMPSTSGSGLNVHIPTTAACEACHKGIPSGQIPANASRTVPGTGFLSPLPTAADIHANVSAACTTCHEAGKSWLGVDAYPRTTTFTNAGASYLGFQTRPTNGGGAYSIADSNHAIGAPLSGECSDCHTVGSGFSSPVLPTTGHIPTTATCGACHKSSDMKVMPSITDIHANATNATVCTNCHTSVNASLYPMTPPIVVPPAAHPSGIAGAATACEVCHVGSGTSMPSTTVVNGASFANSAFSHSGITSGCATCHGVGAQTFTGVTPKNIATLNPGHLPVLSSVACETCHANNIPSMLIPPTGATGTMTTFAGASFDHAAKNASCATCHGQGVTTSTFAGNPSIVVMPQSSVPGPNAHIPTGAACENCHTTTPTTVFQANAALGLGFRTGNTPSKAAIHSNSTGACSTCHEAGMSWIGVDLPDYLPRSAVLVNSQNATYTGFQTRPNAAGTGYSIADAGHPASGECSNCHTFATTGFAAPTMPGTHIPVSSSAICASCHTDSNYSVMPSVTNIHAFADPAKTCKDCHGSATTYPMTPAIVAPASNHIPTPGYASVSVSNCESCHVGSGSSMPSTPVVNGASFANSAFSHTGITSGCATCHATAGTYQGVTPKNLADLRPGHLPLSGTPVCESCHTAVPTTLIPATGATGSMTTFAGATFNHNATSSTCVTCHGQNVRSGSFAGSPNLIVMPSSSTPSPNSHIPTTAGCETCHGTAPTGSLAGDATAAVGVGAGTGFKSPAPSKTVIHTNSSTVCSSCHERDMVWLGVNLPDYPRVSAITGSPTTVYTGFQTRPYGGASGAYSLNNTHPTSGECSTCHSVAGGFTGAPLPINHIPISGSATCGNCHTDPNYSVMPSITNIHNYADPAKTCANCHGSASTYPMTPAIVAPPANHIPTPASASVSVSACESCHVGSGSSMTATPVVNGATFANSAFSHAGITSGCADCHSTPGNYQGVTPKNLANLRPSHMPLLASQPCETCHTAIPSTLIPSTGATGVMTTFAGATFNHNATNSSCVTCHGQGVTSSTFAGNANIIVMPQSGVPGPTAHIPTTNACSACHTTPTGSLPGISSKSVGNSDFRISPPTKDTLHLNVSAACTACHEAGMSWLGVSLADGFYPRTAIYTPNSTARYIGFQTRPNGSGAGYSLPNAAHPTNGECSNCHSVASGFGTPQLPTTGHIPTSAGCSNCHKNPDYKVMPGLTDIHANVTVSPCSTCHSLANAANFPMNPPLVAAPSNHIDMGGLACEVCHVGTGSSMPSLPVLDGYRFAGSLFSHIGTLSSCDTCHGANVTPTSFYGIVPKAISNLSPGHMPANATCETCHLNSIPTGLVPSAGMKTFAGAQFSHTAIPATSCETCHGPGIASSSFAGNPNIVVMPGSSPYGPTAHIPSSTACESCHAGSVPSGLIAGSASKTTVPGTGFKSPQPTTSMIHANVTGGCVSCHEAGMSWVGVNLYPGSPQGYTAHAIYTGFQTRPVANGTGYSVPDASHPGLGMDCLQCHTSFTGFGPPTMPANHIPVSSAGAAACGNCHTNNFVDAPTLTNIHLYAPSQTTNCVQCHSTANAALYPTKKAIVTPSFDHIPMGNLGCESCHMGPTSSIRNGAVRTGDTFAGSLFNHSGTTVDCSYCHGINVDSSTFKGLTSIKTMSYTATPPHMKVNSQVGCDTCHVNSIPTGQVGVGATNKTFAGASFIHTGITADCANCHGPTITPASFAGNPSIVVMPPSASPGGAGSHIPSTTTCESCHLGSMPAALIPGSVTKSVPGTGFQTPIPSSSTIHANLSTQSCNTCHEKNVSWVGMNLYPGSPTGARVPGATYTGFQTRPFAGGTGTSVNDGSHVATGECSDCHAGFTGFGPPTMPTNHIPVSAAGASTCGNCHTDPNFATMPAKSRIHAYAQSATTNCVQCHSAANADLYKLATMTIKAPGQTHMPMGSLSCEDCHRASLTNLTTNDTPSFAGSQFSHSGVTSGCATCHAAGTGPWEGTTNILKVNTATAGTAPSSTVHLPTSSTCENCHLGSTPSTLLSASYTNNQSSLQTFDKSPPTAAMIHGTTTTCNSCHETGGAGVSADVWMGMSKYPITTSAPFKGFQTRPSATAQTAFRVLDAAHPTGGDCSQCHISFVDFASTVKPTNHIPTASAAACTACHTTSNYSAMPTIANIHANAPSQTTNCAQCHSAANAAIYNQLAGMANKLVSPNQNHVDMGNLGCENCHVGSNSSIATLPVTSTTASFRNSAYSHSGVTSGCANCHGDLTTTRSFAGQTQTLTPKPMTAAHVPNTGNVGCEVCHTTIPTNLIPFTGATLTADTFAADKKYSHKGITNSCSTCHQGTPAFTGISNMVVLPPTAVGGHIPSSSAIPSSACEACHLGSTPTALVSVTGAPRAVGTTGFLTPLPTGAMIHNGVTSGCVTCHENPYTWLGVNSAGYPRSPTTKVSGGTYVGFHTRPVASTAGPGLYSVTDANHPTTGDCSNCHGSTTNFAIDAMPANHIPTATGAACDGCHRNMGPTSDFSQMPTLTDIHRLAPSTRTNCAQCHSDANAAKYNNPKVVGMTIKSPASIARHVPYGTVACEVCHVVTTDVVNGATFAGGKYSHTGVTTGCATCHGNGLAANYFTGITNLVAIPATAPMGGASHIPYTAACEVCHAGSTPTTLSSVTGTPAAVSGFRLPAPSASMIHTNSSFSCNQCHETNYVWKGVDLYPITPKTKTTGASYKGFQTRPVTTPATAYGVADSAHPTTGDCAQCHVGTTAFTAGAMPDKHMPTTAACSLCHSADYSAAGLGLPGNLANIHTGIKAGLVAYTTANINSAKSCTNCHTNGGGIGGKAPFAGCATSLNCSTPPPTDWQPTLMTKMGAHVPIGTLDCNACHAAVTPNFKITNMMKDQTMHDSAKVGGVLCKDCHEAGSSWYGVTGLKVRVPSKHTTQNPERMAPANCQDSGCHSKATVGNGFRMMVMPVMRRSTNPDMGRIRPNMQPAKPSRGTLGNTYDHKGVKPGQCKTCHDGKSASGTPARHLMVNTSCDTCHRATTWTPAHFSHNGITPNTCLACHNGMGASSKPGGHFITARSCDSCHKILAWNPVNYQHISPSYKASPDMLTCVSCHVTNGEMIPKVMRGLNRVKPIPVSP